MTRSSIAIDEPTPNTVKSPIEPKPIGPLGEKRPVSEVHAETREALVDLDPPTTLQDLQIALKRVQSLVPAGVAARNGAECLQLQLPVIGCVSAPCRNSGPAAPSA